MFVVDLVLLSLTKNNPERHLSRCTPEQKNPFLAQPNQQKYFRKYISKSSKCLKVKTVLWQIGFFKPSDWVLPSQRKWKFLSSTEINRCFCSTREQVLVNAQRKNENLSITLELKKNNYKSCDYIFFSFVLKNKEPEGDNSEPSVKKEK